jgi:phosphatidylinositol alpha-1,6-mannosyltransferase
VRALAGSVSALPGFVIYEHVDLAVLHDVVPSLRNTPYAVFLHGTEVWRPIEGRRRDALVRAGLLLANSEFTEREGRRVNPWLPPVKVTHLGVASPSGGLEFAAAREPQALVLGRMSGAERYKGHDQILDAWPAIRRAVPSASLVIAGDGDDAGRLRARADGLEGVCFVGHVDDTEREKLFRESRVLLFPSRGEGFGLVGLEAAVRGAAVVGLKGTVIEELFPDGGPVLAEAQDAGAIAAAAIPLLADAEVARSAAEAARRRVQERFLEEHAIERMRGALREWLT